MPPLHLF